MKPLINKLIAIATLTTIISITGCNDQPVETNAGAEPAASVDPATSISNIRENVQGTLDQIKIRDQGLQDLANGVDGK